MTVNQMVAYVVDALNYTSQDSRARIARGINLRYKRVTSSIGLIPSRRVRVSALATVGERDITFTGIEKINAVIDSSSGKDKPLRELSHDEMIVMPLRTEPPRFYSILNIEASSVTIRLDCEASTAFTLYADGLQDATTLAGDDEPAFPESFHDVLLHGVMADEYKMAEKVQLARDADESYERRLSDLKMFIATSAYNDMYQGKHSTRVGWWDSRRRI